MNRSRIEKRKVEFPLNENEVSTLILLEEANFSDPHEHSIITKLMACYSKLVEFYDTTEDPIKNYFQDKMQSMIAKLTRSKQKNDADKYFGKLKAKEKEGGLKLPIKAQTLIFDDPKRQLEAMRTQRTAEFMMSIKLENNRLAATKDVEKKLENFQEKVKENSEAIRGQLSEQESALQRKLQERRQASVSRSMNKSQDISMNARATTPNKPGEYVQPPRRTANLGSVLNETGDFDPSSSSQSKNNGTSTKKE